MINTPRIICVDDDVDTVELMAVAAMDYPDKMFYLHHSVAGGLKRLHQLNYNVNAIILDISLEDGSGRQLTEHIRNHESNYGRTKKIPIFWYSGWKINLNDTYDPITQTFYACGVVKLFVKPVSPIDMFKEITTYLELKLQK